MTGNNVDNLVFISQTIGQDPAYVQGGGGNISVKLDEARMAIKASGGLLKDMTAKEGYSIVDYVAIRNYLDTPTEDENLFTQKIKSFVVETDNRPSIETGFHAQLGLCVIHTHSVYANILACSDEGPAIIEKLFPEAMWIAYATPGRDITLSIRNSLKDFHVKPTIIFLQNHGLIVIGKTAQEVLESHKNINAKIRNYLQITLAIYADELPKMGLEFVKNNVLFPDQVVYLLAGKEILDTLAAKETLWAYNFILKTIKEKELTPHFLPQDKADILLGMESEKYRQKGLKK